MVTYYNKNNVPFLLYIPIINYRLLLFILCEDIKFHTIQRFYLFFSNYTDNTNNLPIFQSFKYKLLVTLFSSEIYY